MSYAPSEEAIHVLKCLDRYLAERDRYLRQPANQQALNGAATALAVSLDEHAERFAAAATSNAARLGERVF